MTDTDRSPLSSSTSGDANGRDRRGRFAKGNSGGPGNPFGLQVAAFRAALVAGVTAEDIQRVMAALLGAGRPRQCRRGPALPGVHRRQAGRPGPRRRRTRARRSRRAARAAAHGSRAGEPPAQRTGAVNKRAGNRCSARCRRRLRHPWRRPTVIPRCKRSTRTVTKRRTAGRCRRLRHPWRRPTVIPRCKRSTRTVINRLKRPGRAGAGSQGARPCAVSSRGPEPDHHPAAGTAWRPCRHVRRRHKCPRWVFC
jgi:hypothetical protein